MMFGGKKEEALTQYIVYAFNYFESYHKFAVLVVILFYIFLEYLSELKNFNILILCFYFTGNLPPKYLQNEVYKKWLSI